MALSARKQLQYWGLAAVMFCVTLWFLGNVILPFVLGAAIAYFLDPVADRIEAMGLSRATAVGVITSVAVLIFVIVVLLVLPTLVQQTGNLIDSAPQMFNNMQTFLTQTFPSIMDEGSALRDTLIAIGEAIRDQGGKLLNSLLGSALSLINLIVLLVVVPVVAVYLLYDWDRMIAEIDRLLPRDHAPVIRTLAGQIDTTLASFIRGMGTVCLLLGSYYAIALMLVGLQFGLVVGAFAGFVTFIPYVGALLGGALAIGLALFQFWGEWVHIGLVAGIFILGQVAEGNFLTPKLVGSSVGLHPVWLIFALSVFGALFGFVGMLVAVPVAASIGVLARFATQQYLGSRLYRGLEERDTP